MDEKGLLEALSRGKFDHCVSYIDEVLADPSSLRTYFEALLRHAFVQSTASDHPVIPVNAIKNISSLRKDAPSKPLLEFATRTALIAEAGKESPKWPEVAPERANDPVFVADIFHALQEGDLEKALEEAALLSLISDNKLYVVELLVEASTRKFEELGLLGYAVFRAAAFCKESDIGPFMIPLIRRVVEENVEHVRMTEPEDFDLESYAWPVLNRGNLEDLVLYAVSHRLWNLDTVKQSAFRGGIALWLADKFGLSGEDPPRSSPNGDPDGAQFLSDNNPAWPIDLGEQWLKDEGSVNPHRFVVLDSVQHLVKVVPESCLIPLAEIVVSRSLKGGK